MEKEKVLNRKKEYWNYDIDFYATKWKVKCDDIEQKERELQIPKSSNTYFIYNYNILLMTN